MLAILGGGFGLYGYLPAALSIPGVAVTLPARYRPILRGRAELAPFEHQVHWAPSEHEALAMATRVVIARRPADQESLVVGLARYPSIQSLVLEKPLAGSPTDSATLAQRLHDRGMPFRVGYTLARTPWARRLAQWIAQPAGHEMLVRWDFMAKHYSNPHATWKRDTSAGGGALRFYGVQLIAAITGSSTEVPQLISSSLTIDAQHTARAWQSVLRFESGAVVQLHVDSHSSAPRFSVHAPGLGDIEFADPFSELSTLGGQDVRVPLLAEILREPSTQSDFAWTQRVHATWLASEADAEIASSVTASFSIPTI